MSDPFPSDRMEYLERLRSAIPRYDELQDQAVKAIPFAPARVLELARSGLQVEPPAFPRAKRETRQVDAVISRAHSPIEISETADGEGRNH